MDSSNDLPQVAIEEIVETLGYSVAARLVDAARGRLLYIPRNPSDLPAVLGMIVAAELAKRFGGRFCQIPMGGEQLREQRDKALRADLKGGMLRRDLMEKYRVSESEMHRALGTVEG